VLLLPYAGHLYPFFLEEHDDIATANKNNKDADTIANFFMLPFGLTKQIYQ
jgi:hypothetical protein